MTSVKRTDEIQYIEDQFPGLQWSFATGDSSRFYTGKVRGISVVSVSLPSGDFFLYDKAAKIMAETESLDRDEKFMINNSAVMYNISDKKQTLKKICETAEKAIKRYYILQKKEEIYAEGNYED